MYRPHPSFRIVFVRANRDLKCGLNWRASVENRGWALCNGTL